MKILIIIVVFLLFQGLQGCTSSSRLTTNYKAKRQVGCARF